jgi:hypothetical protein
MVTNVEFMGAECISKVCAHEITSKPASHALPPTE